MQITHLYVQKRRKTVCRYNATNSYMDAYIKFATTENDSSREYNPIDANRTVLRCVAAIYIDVLHQEDVVTDESELDEFADSIALKLLNVEKAVQERIGQMTDVQKGSIVQALLVDDEGYKFVIAKVEHSEWYDGETLEKNFGFPGENKRVWKSAVIGLDVADDAIIFSSIKIYVKHPAKYWSDTIFDDDELTVDIKVVKTVENGKLSVYNLNEFTDFLCGLSPVQLFDNFSKLFKDSGEHITFQLLNINGSFRTSSIAFSDNDVQWVDRRSREELLKDCHDASVFLREHEYV